MKTMAIFLRRRAVYIVAFLIVLALYGFARLPVVTEAERAAISSRFGFARHSLAEMSSPAPKLVRAVHPSLKHIDAWISSVGASVALNDLDSDGLSNDVCYVNTRTDQVIVASAPGAPSRYAPFTLNPTPLAYDPSTMAPMGCLPGDLNEDGLIDILVYYWGRTPIVFLRKQDGSSKSPLAATSFAPCEAAPGGERWFTNAATLADIDGDGHVDIVIGNYFPDGARILDAAADGREQMQDSMSRAYNGGRNRFLLWAAATIGASPTVRFEEAKNVLDEKIECGWTLALGAADLDGDLLPEIYFANDFGHDRLLHNRSKPGHLEFALLEGKKTLTAPNSKVLGRDSFKGMGVDFGDLNGDGLLDIYVSNIATEYALEESHFTFVSTGQTNLMTEGIAPYVDRSEPMGLSRSGWAWDAKLDDFDNDGILEAIQATGFMRGNVNRWPELHEIAMGNDQLLHSPRSWHRFQVGDDLNGHGHSPFFFVRAGNGRYYDFARELGFNQPDVGRGIAIADVDGDGRLDFAVANQWGPSYFYHNESLSPGSFLGLHLLLPLRHGHATKARPGHPGPDSAGRPAIGASVTAHLPDGRRLVAAVDGGNGHSGKRSPEVHFGLGSVASNTKLQVEIRWRDPQGRARKETLELSPGWHTVLLGWQAGTEEK